MAASNEPRCAVDGGPCSESGLTWQGIWAIPGGMVDDGEHVSKTVKREFIEEAGNIHEDPEAQAAFTRNVNLLFDSGGVVVYQGYVDDPRTTDHAWIETTAFHFHCPPEVGDKLPL